MIKYAIRFYSEKAYWISSLLFNTEDTAKTEALLIMREHVNIKTFDILKFELVETINYVD